MNKSQKIEPVVISQSTPDMQPQTVDKIPPTFQQAKTVVNSSPATQPDYEPAARPNHIERAQSDNNNNAPQTIKIIHDPIPDGVQELIISHSILAKNEYFSGRELFNALQSAGLAFGEMNIFHYPGDENPETFALFSVANVVEPGTFNLDDAVSFKTPGISMFMRLPTRIPCYEAYEEFIHVAQMIASELDGELCDETRSQLTQQAIGYKKEQIRKLNFELAKAEKLAELSK